MTTTSFRHDPLWLVSNLTPWVAPIPSAFFVARSAMKHLDSPLIVAIVLALVIELLGLTSVHTWLRLSNWNLNKRKADPKAPAHLALLIAGLYILVTLGMITVLDVIPSLSGFMPAITPLLAVVGAFNLALISQQERREAEVRIEREERKAERTERRSRVVQKNVQDVVQERGQRRRKSFPIDRSKPASEGDSPPLDPVSRLNHEDALNALVSFFERNPTGSYSAAGRSIGRSKSWVAWAVAELVKEECITKADGSVFITGARKAP